MTSLDVGRPSLTSTVLVAVAVASMCPPKAGNLPLPRQKESCRT